jgi:glycosyltransferase involved in cell wall biosynthesis
LECSEEKFVFNSFAIDDIYEENKELQSPVDYEYSLSIGRSNRDFDFLIKNFPSTEKLIIISDTYVCNEELPKNIVLLNNVSGNSQYKYFNNAKSIIIPIADGTIPSGDTVLLTSMMFSKPIIITKPSTLAEVYVDNMHNGFTLEKNENFKADLKEILSDDKKLAEIGKNARDDFLKKYSREAMGRNLGKLIK